MLIVSLTTNMIIPNTIPTDINSMIKFLNLYDIIAKRHVSTIMTIEYNPDINNLYLSTSLRLNPKRNFVIW